MNENARLKKTKTFNIWLGLIMEHHLARNKLWIKRTQMGFEKKMTQKLRSFAKLLSDNFSRWSRRNRNRTQWSVVFKYSQCFAKASWKFQYKEGKQTSKQLNYDGFEILKPGYVELALHFEKIKIFKFCLGKHEDFSCVFCLQALSFKLKLERLNFGQAFSSLCLKMVRFHFPRSAHP